MRKVFGVLFLFSFLGFVGGLTGLGEIYYQDSSTRIALLVVGILAGIVSLLLLLLLVTNFKATSKRAYWRVPVLAVLAAIICLILGVVASIDAPKRIFSATQMKSLDNGREKRQGTEWQKEQNLRDQGRNEEYLLTQEIRQKEGWLLVGYGLVSLVAGVVSIAFIRKHNSQRSSAAEQVNAP